jgi:hypothetical protein
MYLFVFVHIKIFYFALEKLLTTIDIESFWIIISLVTNDSHPVFNGPVMNIFSKIAICTNLHFKFQF